ncbi:MAG TPA: tetratricopeptide repeat protein [bacterium]|nr:tetratricopeptide repeat protein [bacterium]
MDRTQRFIFCFCALVLACAKVYGYTAADYNNAGLKLYTDKNYAQAIQYFTAALNLEPENPTALQSRANANYFLGNYPQALADYEKILAKNPSNTQVAQFVQALRAKVGSPAPAAAAPSTTSGLVEQGIAFYQQKQYDAAVSVLNESTQKDSNDAKAYYYLGASQVALGDNKEAVLNLTLSNKKSPNPSLDTYTAQLRAGLSAEDKRWVDDQLMSGAGNSGPKKLGLRLQPAFALVTFQDFVSDAETNKKDAAQSQVTDPSYGFDSTIPENFVQVGLEPVFSVSPNFEIGLPFAVAPLGSVKQTMQDSNGYSVSSTFALSAFSIGLDARFLIGPGPFKVFMGGGGLIVPVGINYTGSFTLSSASNTASSSGSFSSIAIGGQGQCGVEYRVGNDFGVALFGEYQAASADMFKGSLTSSGTTTTSTTDSGQWIVFDTPNGPHIGFLKDGVTAPPNSRPLKIDLSGMMAGLQLSVFF